MKIYSIILFISILLLWHPIDIDFYESTGDSICKITFQVRVIDDSCDLPFYEEIPGEPQEVYVYRCRACGLGKRYSHIKRFILIDTIPLTRSNEENIFVGNKTISWRWGTLCVGYSPTNYINGYSIEKIQNGGTTKIHHWNCSIAITEDNYLNTICKNTVVSSVSAGEKILHKMRTQSPVCIQPLKIDSRTL